MIPKPPAYAIGAGDAFRDDKLGRKSFAETLRKAMLGIQTPATIALIGPWGSGKTWFLSAIQAEQRTFDTLPVVVYFDAWAADFSSDPFMAFCNGIEHAMANDPRLKSTEILETFKEKAKRTGAKLLASSLKIGSAAFGAAAGAAVGDQTGLSAVASEKAIEKTIELVSDSIKHSASEMPNERKDFRKSLHAAVSKLRPQSDADQVGESCAMLILVDELDRCRPDFSIKLLESIKHFFDIPGLMFLLAFDDAYMKSAAQAIYGPAFESENYLRRFIDLKFWLPKQDTRKFVGHLINLYSFEHANIEFIAGAIRLFELNPRDAEQAIAACKLLEVANPAIGSWTLLGCIALTIVRFRFPEEVSAVLERRTNFRAFGQNLSMTLRERSLQEFPLWQNADTAIRHADDTEQFLQNVDPTTVGNAFNITQAIMREVRNFPYGDVWRRILTNN